MREQSYIKNNSHQNNIRGGETKIMKKSLVVLLTLALVFTMVTPAFAASADLTVQEQFDALYAAGILTGADGIMLPEDEVVDRQTLAKIACLIAGVEATPDAEIPAYADDYKKGVWGFTEGWIQAAYTAELMQGNTNPDGSTSFDAGDDITMGHLMAVILRAMGETDLVETGAWYKVYMEKAAELNLVSADADGSAPATYANIVEQTYTAKEDVLVVEPETFEVVSVDVLNAHQVKINFSKALNEKSAETIGNYALSILPATNLLDGTNPKADLDSTGKAVILSFENSYSGVVTNQTTLKLIVQNVKSSTGEVLAKYTNDKISVLDVTVPTYVQTTQVSPTTFDIEFSEPVSGGAAAATLAPAIRVANGVYSVTVLTRADSALVAPNVIRISTGTSLPAGEYKLDINNVLFTPTGSVVKDYAGFNVTPITTSFTVTADTVAPTASILKVEGSDVYVQFSEIVTGFAAGNLKVRLDYNNNSTETNTIAAYDAVTDSYKVSFSSAISAGNHVIYIHYISDTSTMIEDTAKNDFVDDVAIPFTVEVDNAAPTAVASLNTAGTAIELAFSETVVNATLQSSYVLKDANTNTISYTLTTKAGYDNTYVFTPASQPQGVISLKVLDHKIKDISVAQNYMSESNFSVDFGDKIAPLVTSVALDTATATKVYVYYNESMAVTGTASILNLDNYRYSTGGALTKFPTDATITLGVQGDKSAVITLSSGIAITTLKVVNCADVSGNMIDAFTALATTATQDNAVNLLKGGANSTTLGATVLKAGAIGNVTAKNQVIIYTDKPLAGIDASKIKVNNVIVQSASYENVTLTAGDGVTPIYGAKVTLTLTTGGKLGAAPDLSTGVLINAGAFSTQNGTLTAGITAAGLTGAAAAIQNTTATTWNLFVDQISPQVASVAMVDQVWALDHGPVAVAGDKPDGKIDKVIVKMDEIINQASVSATTFTVADYNVSSATVIATLDTITFAELDAASLTAANGAYVVLEVTPLSSTAGTADTPVVSIASAVRDASNNEGVDSATAINLAGPVVTAAKFTVPGATAANWDEVGDELTLTFSEAPVIPAAITDADSATDGLQLTAGNLNAILGGSETAVYGGASVVTAVVDGKTIKLTITGAALTTPITTAGTIAGGTVLTDSLGLASVANATPVTPTN